MPDLSHAERVAEAKRVPVGEHSVARAGLTQLTDMLDAGQVREVAIIVAAYQVACEIVETWQEASAELGDKFPEGCCVEVCVQLRDELDERLPDAEARYVWGDFLVDYHRFGHAWVEVAGGIILDPTAGQFFRSGPPLRLVLPRTAMASHYAERP